MTTSTVSITNAVVFDGESADLTAGTIEVVDGRVAAVTDGGAEGERTIDAGGNVVIPGMIDCHFHAYGVSLDMLHTESLPLSLLAFMGSKRLGGALRRGFTTVRDVAGGDPGLATAIERGMLAAPRYFYTGPALSQTGGHGDPRPGDLDVCACNAHTSEVVDGVEPLRVAVRDRFRRGAHAIKIMTSGGVISLTDPLRIPQYSAEEVRAVTDEAIRRGSYVAAHAYSPDAIRHSVENGVRSIEHGNLMDAETAALMAEHDAVLVPTLATYDAMERRGAEFGMAAVSREKNRLVLESGKNAIELARAAGVTVGFGTDLMGELEDEQLQGLRLQVEVDGVLDTLRAATTGNAAILRRDDLGRIREGSVADVVILDGDPFEDETVLWSESRRVIQGGVEVTG